MKKEKRLTFSIACMDEIFQIERMTLWLIIPAFLFYLFTGYNLTRLHILSKTFTAYVHFFACGFFAALLLVHLLGRARCILARHKVGGSKVDSVLLVTGVVMMVLLVIMELA